MLHSNKSERSPTFNFCSLYCTATHSLFFVSSFPMNRSFSGSSSKDVELVKDTPQPPQHIIIANTMTTFKMHSSSAISVVLLLVSFCHKYADGFSFFQRAAAPAQSQKSAAELLELLVDKHTTSSGTMHDRDNERVDSLVSTLAESKVRFDPKECIDGPLFVTCYFSGKKPLWEKIGALRKQRNLKGQKYTLGDEENRVVNYSEILGSAINLQASGTFQDSDPKTAIKTCPFDYPVTVTNACVSVFGKQLKLPIQGTGVARVLYADSNLRIFVSPDDTRVTSGGGDWESAGLVTVQVRADLIDPYFDENVLVGARG